VVDKLIHQKVVLAPGGRRWWAVDQGRIGVELTLRGDRFQIPRPPRFASKPPCIPPQQPVQPCGADMPSAPPQEPTLPDGTDVPTASIQDANDAPRPDSTQARRGGWRRLKLTEPASTVRRAIASGLGWIAARTCSLLAGIPMRLISRLGIWNRSRPAV
jgi:DNA-binding transcriptional LysR family regulator